MSTESALAVSDVLTRWFFAECSLWYDIEGLFVIDNRIEAVLQSDVASIFRRQDCMVSSSLWWQIRDLQ
jgi:hypothetical protein